MNTITTAIAQSVATATTVTVAFDGDVFALMSECFAVTGEDCDSTEADVVFGTTEDGGQYQLRIV